MLFDTHLSTVPSLGGYALFRPLIDSMQAYVCLLSPSGEVIDINSALKRASGMSIEHLAGTPFELAPWWASDPIVMNRLKNAIIIARQGSSTRFDVGVLSDDGQRIIDMTISAARDDQGEVSFLTCVGQDVTRQRADEVTYKESEAYLKFATESAEVGIWSLELPSEVLIWSDFHKKMWGYEQNFDQLRYDDWHRIIHPEDVQAAFAAVENARLTRTPYVAEYRIHRASDGEVRWMRSVGQYFFDPVTDEPYKLTGVSYDITNRKTFEKELKRQVDEQTEELKIINAQMERFSFVAAHDLQSPLRKIEMFAGLLRERSGQQLSASGHTYLDKITNAAQRMRNLVDVLLQLSKIKSDQSNFTAVDLNTLLTAIVESQEINIQEKGAVVTVDKILPHVWGAPWQLDVLFSNLLANSLKFVRPGVTPQITVTGRVLGHDEAAQLVRLTDRSFVLITVEDNGTGFDQEFAEQMFEMFKRLHEDVQGTGIGLAICKKVAENHLGQIRAIGVPGKGARFEVVLPLASQE